MTNTLDLTTATAQEYFTSMAIDSWRANPIDGIAQAPTTPIPGVVEYISPDATPVEMYLRKGTPEYVLVPGDVDPFWATIPGNPAKTYLFFPKGLTNASKISIKIGHHTWYDLSITVSTQNPFPPGTFNWSGDDIARDFPGITPAPGLGDPHRDPPGVPHIQATRALAPQQRALMVYEANPVSAGGGRMFALDANTATGIPIPAFRNVTVNPPTGQLVGEAILNTTTGQSFVWTGAIWQGIVPPSVIPYPTDTDVLTDNLAPAGTHAFSQSSGNFFTRYTDAGGTDQWRQIGIRVYPLEAGLLADTAGDGSVAYAADTNNLWLRVGTSWEPLSAINDTEANILAATYRDGVYAHATDTDNSFIRTGGAWQPTGLYRNTDATVQAATFSNGTVAYATDTGQHWYRIGGAWQPGQLYKDSEANILAATYQDGTVAYATDTNLFYYRVNGNWVLNTPLVDTEANIKAATTKVGQIAIATDTGKLWVGTATGWQGQPFRDYATEAALLADTPIDGTMALAVDTGKVYYRSAGTWIGVGGINIPVGTTDPATAATTAGDMYYNSADQVAKVYDGGAWQTLGTPSQWAIGSIQQSILTHAQFTASLPTTERGKWKIAIGQDITGTALATLTGQTKLPDLRGAYFRMAGQNASNAAWQGGNLGAFEEDKTARPDIPFTTDRQGNHDHWEGRKTFGDQAELFVYRYHSLNSRGWVSSNEDNLPQYQGATSEAGAHTHTINGGGDVETRPKTYSVNYFIKTD